MRQKDVHYSLLRQQRLRDLEQQLELRHKQDSQQREHLAVLRDMGVDLTAYLTQARADKVIELRGATAGTHVHLEQGRGEDNGQRQE